MPKPDETAFENHFCHQLELAGFKKRHYKDIAQNLCLHTEELVEFLDATQKPKLQQLQAEYGQAWRKQLSDKLSDALQTKRLFQILKDGLEISSQIHLDLVDAIANKSTAKAQDEYKDRFTYIRQYHFESGNQHGTTDHKKSVDIVLFLNGFAIVSIELKNIGTSGNYTEAIKQYLQRDLNLPVFTLPFLHIVCDNETAMMAASFSRPPSADDFRPFNKGLLNTLEDEWKQKKEYPVHYLYHEVLLPESLLNYIETYLYTGKHSGWIFPRYHQQRSVRRICTDIAEQVERTDTLNLRYLVQHSTGSGKSNTIVWLVQNLRNLHVNNTRLFDSVVVLTDRVNLDGQISDNFKSAIDSTGIVAYTDRMSGNNLNLKEALQQNYKVIVSTIHKFSHLKDLEDQTGKRICVIIDEGHRSQEGSLHEKMTDTFDAGTEDELEKLAGDISKKVYPNLCFIGLTATPSDLTLERFGRKNKEGKWEPFDVYSMDEAIEEGYILDVVKNVITYETLYELNYKYDSEKEYPPLQIYSALKKKAFEDDEVIKEKCGIIATTFKKHTAHKINGFAKAMVVTSSRLAAVKYKLFLDEVLQKKGLKYKALVAFSGTIHYNGHNYTEAGMNAAVLQERKLEDAFEKDGTNRFLIVANKYQTGFDEPLLHTMFLDKSLSDPKNIVQTLSRLNRTAPGKEDTLTVDFTNSYDNIIAAFKKYQKHVTSHKEAKPEDLYELKNELLKKGVFTAADVEECLALFRSEKGEDAVALVANLIFIKKTVEGRLDAEERRVFRTLLSRYVSLFRYIRTLFRIPQGELHELYLFARLLYRYLDTTMTAAELEEEMRHVKLKRYDIAEVDVTTAKEDEDDGEGGEGGGNGGNVTSVSRMATVAEVVEIINLRFQEKVSPEGAEVIEGYAESMALNEELAADIRGNADKNAAELYEKIIKDKLVKYYTDYIIKHNPLKYTELTDERVLSLVSKATYQMLRGRQGL